MGFGLSQPLFFQSNSFGLRWPGVNNHVFGGSNSAHISVFGVKYLRDLPPQGTHASWWGQASLFVGSTKCFGAIKNVLAGQSFKSILLQGLQFSFSNNSTQKKKWFIVHSSRRLGICQKKFTRPNFRAKEFYTLKTPKSRLFSPPVNSKNASSSVIWPSFGSKWTKCVNSLTVMKEVYI